MTLEGLIAAARVRSNDTVAPFFCEDATWVDYANDAEREACRRSRLILDSTTTAICQIDLAAGDVTADLDSRVLFIRRARLVGRSGQLGRISTKELDARAPDWEDETGEPRGYVPDYQTGKFRPYPTPTDAGTVKLTVARLPLADMGDGDSPEIASRFHEGLIDWMLHRYYSTLDADVQDPKKAAAHLAKFEEEFGKKSTAQDEVWLSLNADYLQDEGNY